ncbi:hypothetical protein E2N92_02805 [Methanofollis formosanus]|uniref:Uncharacterized protein n=1 Tax=Methanofollis formosanus TaxID=299308 RepID=A0A8G1EFT2_9EURY|nr:hypothetical protein [Methanofollis formosanus]QYZ78436.1 hypothetical protein E2N92_02805 [Methanofollis formosanus]
MKRKHASSIPDENIIPELDRFLILIFAFEECIEVEHHASPWLSSSRGVGGVSPRRETAGKILQLRAARLIIMPSVSETLISCLPTSIAPGADRLEVGAVLCVSVMRGLEAGICGQIENGIYNLSARTQRMRSIIRRDAEVKI